jgi:hypothetical protein
MVLREQEHALLLDQQGQVLGEVTIRQVRDPLVFGEFLERPAFAAFAPLFAEHREAANQQLFSRVEELDEAIETLGLRLRASSTTTSFPLRNLSIGAGRISLELCESPSSESDGKSSAARSAKGVSMP